jgi:streptogramin lyase
MFMAFLSRLKLRLLLLSSPLLLLCGCGSSQLSSAQHPQKTLIPPGTISEFPIGGPATSIAAGPDGNLWFTEKDTDKIGRMTPRGIVTIFAIPTPKSQPLGITAGPDGNLWFTEIGAGKIGRITPSGTITEFVISIPYSDPSGITTGPDGNLCFFNVNLGGPTSEDQIVRMTPASAFTVFQLPVSWGGDNGKITVGPDGNLWFTDFSGDIGRMTLSGSFTKFSLPTLGSLAVGITAGPDGNLWFTDFSGDKIGRMTPSGTITEFSLPTSPAFPVGITAGPDGNLWFTESEASPGSGAALGLGQIGRITPSGTITEFPVPIPNNNPDDIIAGSDGNLWFPAGAANIGRILSGK